jgi:asparagine synthase (glutamine-hydrolysing)
MSRLMTDAIRHRGPNDEGVWVDAEAGIALGHRRLSILDLSQEGHQPMKSANGRYVLVFNGEIYNFQTLREQLAARGHSFRGHSDTEVMLAGFCEWGIKATLQKQVGMFALALWDRQERVLHLTRDRIGEKPLYFGWSNGTFLFGSELKALQAHPDWQGKVDLRSVSQFLRLQRIPAPYCVYEGIRKLEPGCILSLTEQDFASQILPKLQSYWSLQAAVQEGRISPWQGTDQDAVEELDRLLARSVGEQLVADVPLGAFLSGGIDSSTVVALMQRQCQRPVKTFSIGFEEENYNEATHAKQVAAHLGTDHTEFFVDSGALQKVIYELPGVYDEPFADSSEIPTLMLCKLARQQVTVSLTGDAGDEVFGGYSHYLKTERLWNQLSRVPLPLREALAPGLKWTSNAISQRSRPEGRLRDFLKRVSNMSDVLPASSDLSLYELMTSSRDRAPILRQGPGAARDSHREAVAQSIPGLVDRMMYFDTIAYLPDNILVKVDRAAMAVSLETRIPILDHRVVEFAWRLPRSLKFRNGLGKWLLRQVLYKYVPREMVERPKMGFSVPLAVWLRGPLRDWVENLIDPTRLKREGFFDYELIGKRWQQHKSGAVDWGDALWTVIMFQSWLGSQRPGVSGGGVLASCGRTM